MLFTVIQINGAKQLGNTTCVTLLIVTRVINYSVSKSFCRNKMRKII